MLLRILTVFLSALVSVLALANERVVVDLSLIEQLTEKKCSFQNTVLDCSGQDLVLKTSTRHGHLKVKAAHIEVQGKVEGEQLDLEATEDIVIAQGASLFLKKSSSMTSQGEFRVQGGLLALKLEVSSSSVLFAEGSDVQVQKLNIQTADFRMKNRLVAQILRLTLTRKANLRKVKLYSPYAEFSGYLQAQMLTVKGPGPGSQFVVSKQGFLDAEQILVITKSYLNLGKMRFSTLKINGQEHSNYGRTEGLQYSAAAEQVHSREGALYKVHSAQIWGRECKDSGKWDVKNTLGFYCQTMTAGQDSVWQANSVDLAGGTYFLDNSIISNDLKAQVQTLYATKSSTQKIAKAIVLAKHLLLDGTWQGQEAHFFADAVFFGPNANINIKNLEIIVRNKETKLVRELLNSQEKSHLDQIEKIFEQLFELEEQFSRSLANSLSNGQFALEKRWQIHQFRARIYDSFKEKNATWVAYRLAQLSNELGLSGASGAQSVAELRQAAYASERLSTFPMHIFGAINSHNLKITSDGKLYFDASSQVDVSKILQVRTKNLLFIDGVVRAKVIDLFAQSFALAEAGLISADELGHLHSQQQVLLRGLLSPSSHNNISVQDGEIYIGKSALVKSSDCTSIGTKHFYLAAKIEGACLHLIADKAFLDVGSRIDIVNSAKIKAKSLELRGTLTAQELHIKTQRLKTSITNFIEGSELDISTMESDLYGLINSGNLFLDSQRRLVLRETGQLQSTGKISLKSSGNIELSGQVRAKLIDFFAEQFRLAQSGQVTAQELVKIRTKLRNTIEGLLKSDGSIVVSSDGALEFIETANVHAAQALGIRTAGLVNSGSISAAQADIFAEQFRLTQTGQVTAQELVKIRTELRNTIEGLLKSDGSIIVSSDGELEFAETANVHAAQALGIRTTGLVNSGSISAAQADIFAEQFRLTQTGQVTAQELVKIRTELRNTIEGLLKSDGSIIVSSDGELEFAETANVHAAKTLGIIATRFAASGSLTAAQVEIFAEQLRLAQSGKMTAQELIKVYTKLENIVEGLLKSNGSIIVSSDGSLEFTETANVHAAKTFAVRAARFSNSGSISAAQIDIDVKELTAFANSKLDAPNINISAVSSQLAGVLHSDRLFINTSGNLQIRSNADIQVKNFAHIKAKDLEVAGSVKAKVIELFAANIDLLEHAKLSAEEQMLVKADLQLKIKGLLSSDGSLHVEGDHVFFNSSAIVHAATVAHIKAKHIEASAALEARDLQIVTDTLKTSTASLINGHSVNLDLIEAELYGVINSKNLVINAEKRLVLRDSAKISAEGSATLKGSYVELGSELRAKMISLFAKDLVLLKNAKLTAEQSLAIQSSFKAKFDGLLESGSSLVVVAGEIEIAQTGKITAQETQIKSDSFLSSGIVSGKEVLILDVEKSFFNKGTLQGNRVGIHTNAAYANSGAISAVEDLYIKVSKEITAKELGKTSSGSWTTLQGDFHSDDVLDLLEGNSGHLQTAKLRVITSKPVVINRNVSSSFANDLYAASLTLEEDKIYSAQGDISLNVGNVHAKAGSRLHSGGSLQVNADGDVIQESERNSENGNIRTSEIDAEGSLRITAKGRYVNIGSRLQAKETLVIKTEGGVVIVPLLWVETSKKVKKGWFTKKTTIKNEEKEQRSSLSGKNIEIETDQDSTVENVDWTGDKKFSPKISETHRELKIDETSYKSYTGLGKVLMTAVRTASLLASNLVPGGNFVAGLALNYLESQILSQKFDLKAALKQAVIGAIAGEIANSAVGLMGGLGGSVAAAVTKGTVRSSVSHLTQACLNDGCKKIDLNQLGSAAFVGAVHGGITAGSEDNFLEHATREAGAGFVGDAGIQAMQGGRVKWDQAGESALLSGVAYASAHATSELLKPNPIESPVKVEKQKQETKEPKAQKELEPTRQVTVEKPKKVEPTPSAGDQKPKVTKEAKPTLAKAPPSQKSTELKKISPRQKTSLDPIPESRPEPVFEAVQVDEPVVSDSRPDENKIDDLVDSVCFAAGTRVRTEMGWEPIEALREGDTVISCDFQGEQCVSRTITKTMVSHTPSIVHLRVKGGIIDLSPNHPVYVVDDNKEQFVAVGALKVGDAILAINGERAVIEELEIEKLAEPMIVYNLEVDDTHNYYVSSPDGNPQDLLVHNCDVAQKVGKHAKDFGAGLVAGAAESVAGEHVKTRGNKAFEDGRFAGKLSGAVAQVATGIGGVVAAGGAAVASCATGVACPLAAGAVAAAGASAAVAAHGSHLMMETLGKAPELLKQDGGTSKSAEHSVMMNEKLEGGEDRFSRVPKSLQDEMVLDASKQGVPDARKIIENLKDPKFKGMEKWEYKVKSTEGKDSVVHYVRDPNTGTLMDFKFKKHSTD